jgi:hypothetical protein
MLRPFATVVIALACNSVACAQNKPNPSTYEERLARYNECLKRKVYQHHHEARVVLGGAGNAEALTLLIKDYASVKTHAEYIRYTLADVFGQRFQRTEFIEPLRALCNTQRGPGDTWLWFNILEAQASRDGEEEVIKIATEDKSMLLRAAAILALGEAGRGDLRKAIVPNCVEFPKKEADRMLLLGAMSGAFNAGKARINDEEYRGALTAYIGLLGPEVKLPHIAKVQMARHLQIILKAPAAFENAEAWLEILARGDVKTKPSSQTRSQASFFGVETDGERMCYVVDMSDSMLKPIEPSAKPQTLTGPRPKKKKGAVLDESDLPWEQIKTRWDLARENLRISLSRLTPDKEFCVVWFGSECGTLDSCKGIIKATRANIDKVMEEFDGVKARHDKQTNDEEMPPEGKLRGDTNMHGGLRLAMALHSKGFAGAHAYVDPQVLTEGCDTILLLSDGDPSIDDFHEEDKNYGEGRIIKSYERKEAAPDAARVGYSGPYVFNGDAKCPELVADVRRMNAFRRIRLHCVGLGEANMTLMAELAKIGNGESISVGKKAEPAGGGPKK